MTITTPLSRIIQALCALLLIALVDGSPPGWSKFSTAIHHQDIASQDWRTSSDDVRLMTSRKKNRAATETPEIGKPTLAEKILVRAFMIGGITAMEYASGYLGAYVLGTLTGLPGLAFSKEGLKVGERFSNMNARSKRWAKSWAPIAAVFGGSDAATRIIRGNRQDQWNTIISSAAAGAYFSRAGMEIYF